MRPEEFARKIHTYMEGRRAFAVATVVRIEGSSLGKPGFRAIITEDGNIDGSLGGVCPESAIVDSALKALRTGQPRIVRIFLENVKDAISGMVKSSSEDEIHVETFCGGTMDVYIDPFLPSPRLVLIGQGGKDDVEDTLVHLGKLMEMEVVVIDRTPMLTEEPDALVKDVREDFSNFDFRREDFVVLLTKGAYDIPALEALSRVKPAYVGLLASRKRSGEDFEILRSKGVDEDFIRSVHTPVGLNIGAISSQEIALSIMAEIVSIRRASGSQKINKMDKE